MKRSSNPGTRAALAPYLASERRAICVRLEAAEKGHPKPEQVKKITAELEAFDREHPEIRNARQAA